MDMAALPAEPDPGAYSAQVRVWSTGQLIELINALEPYVRGSFGEVIPQHAQVYVAAIKEINRIWRVGVPVPPEPEEEEPDPVETARVEAARMRARVQGQLQALVSRSAS